MPSFHAGGFDAEGCMPLCLVCIVLLVGTGLAVQGATTSNYTLMTLGLILVFGTLALAGGGYIKFKL